MTRILRALLPQWEPDNPSPDFHMLQILKIWALVILALLLAIGLGVALVS